MQSMCVHEAGDIALRILYRHERAISVRVQSLYEFKRRYMAAADAVAKKWKAYGPRRWGRDLQRLDRFGKIVTRPVAARLIERQALDGRSLPKGKVGFQKGKSAASYE
jgi:hypothetical protein